MEKRTENRLLFGWFASSLKLLFFCFTGSVIDSTSLQIVNRLALAGMALFKIIWVSPSFLVSYYWMKPELIFHGLPVLHSHGVLAAFMAFASNISSLFLLGLSWSLWNFRFAYLVSFDKSRSTRQPGMWESSLQMRSRGCSKRLMHWTGDQGWGRRPADPMLCPHRKPLAWGHCSPLSPPVDGGFSALALLTLWPE